MTKKSNTVELVSDFGKIKSCRGIYTVAALKALRARPRQKPHCGVRTIFGPNVERC